MKIKFNVMDFIIVLILLGAVAAGVLFLGGGSGGEKKEDGKTIQLQVELKEKEEEFTKLPQVGDIVMVGVKEKMETKVTKVEVKPAMAMGYDLVEGKAGEVPVPERYDVYITMEGEGTETESEVRITGVAARVGAEAVVKSKNWAGIGFIMAVNPL